MQATARLFGQTAGAALVALVFAAMPETGPVTALAVAAMAAAVAAAVSFSRLATR